MHQLIVVCTNNGYEHLARLFDSMEEFGAGAPILVVDTGSTNIELVKEVISKYSLDISLYERKGGRTTGAYLSAYRNFPADYYMFMQDSMKVKCSDWLGEFHSRMTPPDTVRPVGCVPWLGFDIKRSTQEEMAWAIASMGKVQCTRGIFGPVFYTSRVVLDKLKELKTLPRLPQEKIHECGNERAWAMAFEKAGFGQNPINMDFKYAEQLYNDSFNVLTKFLVDRKA